MPTEKRRSRLVLRDVDPAVQPTSLAIHTLDAAGKVLHTTAIGKEGDFDLPAEAVAKASRCRRGSRR